jgi:hypothetical protein
MNVQFSFQITPLRELLQKVEVKIDDIFKDHNRILREQTLMVVVELLDNAVKYGMSVPGIEGIDLGISVTDKSVEIRVSNTVDIEEHLDLVRKTIEEIGKTGDAEALYTRRLKELMNGRKQGESRLGLYRIAYEGEFELSYEYKDKVLTIAAMKELNGGNK